MYKSWLSVHNLNTFELEVKQFLATLVAYWLDLLISGLPYATVQNLD